MTATLYPEISCDIPECYSATHSPAASTAADVRRIRKADGWHRTRSGKDICPDCWSAGHR